MVQQGSNVHSEQNRMFTNCSRVGGICGRCCRGDGTMVLDVLLLWSASVI